MSLIRGIGGLSEQTCPLAPSVVDSLNALPQYEPMVRWAICSKPVSIRDGARLLSDYSQSVWLAQGL